MVHVQHCSQELPDAVTDFISARYITLNIMF